MTQVGFQKSSSDGMKTNPVRDRVVRLTHILSSRLDEHDLHLLCFQLGIDYYYLPGEKKGEKTKALIDLLERHGRIPELIRMLLLLHPDIPWKKLLDISHYPSWMRRFAGRLNKSLPAIILVLIICALFVFIPLSSANWNDVLGVSGEIFTGTWDDTNCTHSIGYWKEHPEAWPVDEITLGVINYSKEDALLILDTPPRGDATYLLAYQLIVANLNILNGAESSVVLEITKGAHIWLQNYPLSSKPGNPERKTGVDLAATLELYNNGSLGPGHCIEGEGIIIGMPMEITPETLAPLENYSSPTPDDGLGGGNASRESLLPTVTLAPTGNDSPLPTVTPIESPPLLPTLTPTEGAQPTLTLPPSESPRPTPTLAPTMNHQLTPTIDPSIDMALTPTLAPTSYEGPAGCTFSLEYWLDNPDVWSLDEFKLGELTLDQASALEVLANEVHEDATLILGQQYITAQLNIASPADPTDIIDLLESAQLWLGEHPLGSSPKNPDRKAGIQLADALEEYNVGSVGPGTCEQLVSTSTPTSTSTPLPTQTPSDRVTPTLAPTQLPTMMPTLFFTPTP